ncbi:MAG TPA: stage II sporulation protein M [Opitutaceae bacterium]|jgi:uncharacterized membrane protein SpoIIM required for sporulation
MIVDQERFIAAERASWERLGKLLDERAADPFGGLTLEQARELDSLYQRATADLSRLAGYAAHPEVCRHLEAIVARAFAEIYGARTPTRWSPWSWVSRELPQTFRRRWRAFALACLLCLTGVGFGAGALWFDPAAKAVVIPLDYLQGDPRDRVAHEKEDQGKRLDGNKAGFSGLLMTHNTQVALACAAGGVTAGVLTGITTFYNGVILGAVTADYVRAGETAFLCGWLLPHGCIEIPAFLIAAQAAFVLAGAMLAAGGGQRLSRRVRAAAPDFATLCGGCALMLIWAGLMEAFFSQYHEPVVSYGLKISIGLAEGCVVVLYYFRAGRSPAKQGERS